MQEAFLIATTQYVLVLDKNHALRIIHSGSGLYFGLARDENYIYIACQKEVACNLRMNAHGSILIFDKKSLTLTDELIANFPLRDIHDIALFDDKLWIACSRDNLIAIYDFSTQCWSKWYPNSDVQDQDVNHFNTITLIDNKIGIVAHNFGASDLFFFDRISLKLNSVLHLGYQAHNIFLVNDAIATCSSGQRLLINTKGWALRLGSYPRGIAWNKKSILIGISEFTERGLRPTACGVLRIFNKKWRHVKDILLPGVGEVTAILKIYPDSFALNKFQKYVCDQKLHKKYHNDMSGNIYHAHEPDNEFNTTYTLPGWHQQELTHRWSATQESHMEIVINPGEKNLWVNMFNGYSGSYHVEILLNNKLLRQVKWKNPKNAQINLKLPSKIPSKNKLTFRVPHLWKAPAPDPRMLGICLINVSCQ